MTSEAWRALQQAETHLHTAVAQRAAVERTLTEVEGALAELKDAPEAYRITGHLMVKSDPAALAAELEERKATLTRRADAARRAETAAREAFERLQKETIGDAT